MIETDPAEYVLGEDDYIIPIYIYNDGTEKITTIKETFEIASSHSDNAETLIKLKAFGEKFGYTSEMHESSVFRFGKSDHTNTSRILDTSIECTDDIEFLTDIQPENIDSESLITATVINGKAVSVCWQNPGFDGTETSIGVETAEKYRNLGYGASNVALMTDLLIQNGYESILYAVENDNIPSIKIAESCGFERIAEEAVFVWEK